MSGANKAFKMGVTKQGLSTKITDHYIDRQIILGTYGFVFPTLGFLRGTTCPQ